MRGGVMKIAALLLAGVAAPAMAQDEMQGHVHGAAAEAGPAQDGAPEDAIPKGVAPPVPTDHAADALYDPAVMERARKAMLKESGGMTFSKFMLDRLEYSPKNGGSYHWQAEGWIGGDINRLALRSEGEGSSDEGAEDIEVQALYSRALDPWWNVVAGVRHDFRPGPQRTYATVGIEGLAPYWFELDAQAFLSDKGDAHFRLEGEYDQRITQKLILQPSAELSVAAQDVPELGIGSGLSTIELGLRLRYEIRRGFAPYVGVKWERKLGGTAQYARDAGEGIASSMVVFGIRFWL